MIKQLFQKLLKNSGKTYTIDPQIPDKLIVINLWRRFRMLARGMVWYQRKIFVGHNCRILNKSNIIFGKNVTIDHNTIIDGFAAQKLYFGDNVQFPFSIHECIYIHAFLIPNLSTGPNLLPSASSLKDPLEPRYLAQRNVMILTLGIPIADSLACYCAIKPVSPQARNMLTMIASQNGFGKDFEPQQ